MDKITARRNHNLSEEIASVIELSQNVKDAIAQTNREAFVPTGFKHQAYKLNALPIGGSQWISSPLTVAKMTQYLDCSSGDRVLEIGCGSGYQAAVLSKIFRGVFTIERIESLMLEARERFKTQNLHNIHTRVADGQLGWPSYAPYDRILLSASATQIPDALFAQLAPRGILVAPMQKEQSQEIVRYVKIGNHFRADRLERCEFVPVLDGVQK